VSSHSERDQAVERLLRAKRARGAPEAAPTEFCPSTDDIAAWADGDLDPSRAAALEAHIANCAHCEAVVAVFAKTTPLPTPGWTRWRMLLPFIAVAAAASVALAVWSWRNSGATPSAIGTTARVETAPPQTPAPTPVPDVPVMRPAEPVVRSQPASPATVKTPPRAAAESSAPADAKPIFEPPPAAPTAGTPAMAPPPPRTSFPLTAGGSAAANAATAQGQVTVTAQSPLIETRTPPPPPPAAQAAAPPVSAPPPPRPDQGRRQVIIGESPLVDTKKTTTGAGLTADLSAVAEFTSGPDPRDAFAATDATASAVAGGAGASSASAGRGGGRGGGGGTRPTFVVVPPVKWRIFPSGAVQRSFDNGSTWSPVSLASGQQAVAGVAPAPQVCWLVGRAGLVLLMTDGVDFKSVTRPAPVDLRFVRIDGTRVIVSAVDGASYVTTDNGKTWTREGGLQGFPTASF
jgi:hypothetical protein